MIYIYMVLGIHEAIRLNMMIGHLPFWAAGQSVALVIFDIDVVLISVLLMAGNL